ncbi:hypothetical protein Celaphus_00011124, partial [Cervus elaphus hippelaphus]
FQQELFWSRVRMSIQTPPRLLDLVGMHLLRDDDLAFSTLETFHGRCVETLKATVQTWPFDCLPVGALIDLPHVGPLQAENTRSPACPEGLIQEVQTAGARFTKYTGQNFGSMWSGASSYGCSSSGMAPVNDKAALGSTEDFMDLCLKKKTLDNFLTYFLCRESLPSTCVVKKLMIVSTPMENIMKVLSMVQLECIQEVQTSNLQRIQFFPIHMSAFKKQEKDYLPVQITSQFLRVGHLQDLHLESPFFLGGCLDQMLRMLCSTTTETKVGGYTGLVALVRHTARKIQIIPLGQPVNNQVLAYRMTHLSQSPDISQLKSLVLSGVTMTDFRPELLQVLLEKVGATIQELDFDVCRIIDSQLEAFLPALSRCSRLRSFSLCGNLLSTAAMEKLLQECYPAPQETYRPRGVLLEARLAQLRAQLLEILRDLGCPRIIWISLSPCPRCGEA